MAVLLGLAAALGYGLSDFLAGLLSRRLHYALVAVIGNLVAFLLTAAALALTARGEPTVQAIGWGAVSGCGGGFGTLMLYRGLGRGRMGVVAPLSALGAAALPVVIGVALGDRPAPLVWSGIVMAMPAIWLVSTSGDGAPVFASAGEPTGSGRPRLAEGVVEGLLAGVGFALLFIGLKLAGEGSGLWPVAAAQASSTVLLAVVLVALLRRLDLRRMPRRDLAATALVGALGAAAAVFYFVSAQAGLLSIVAVLTALYPAATVLLAAGLLHEAITRRQGVGLVLAGTSVVLIVLG